MYDETFIINNSKIYSMNEQQTNDFLLKKGKTNQLLLDAPHPWVGHHKH